MPRDIGAARRPLGAAVAALTLAVAALAGWPPRPAAGPNVVLIVVDTLRADHVGSYGYDRPTTPRLDALAARGARFARAYAPSSWTGPSVASLLTGLYPAVHGLERHQSVLSPRIPRIAQAFHAGGWATAAFSANPAFVSPEAGLGAGFQRFSVLHGRDVKWWESVDHIWADAGMQRLVEVAAADRVTDTALAWATRRGDAPFFLYVHYFDPHASYLPPPAWMRRFGVDPATPLATGLQRAAMLRGVPLADPADMATLVNLYDGEIAFTDDEIGRLLDGLAAHVPAPTLVLVTADHGEEFGDHGGLQHGRTLFEEQLRVPLIAAALGREANTQATADTAARLATLAPGTVVDTPLSLVDVWPLVAALAGVDPPPGRAPLPLAGLAAAAGAPPPVFADLRTLGRLHRWANVDGTWKLIVRRDRTNLLFDLAADPREQHDLASTDPVRTGTLRRALAARNVACVAARTHGAPVQVPMSDARRERLRALGYVE